MQLSTSEARAEACTIILRRLLQTLDGKERGRLLAASVLEAKEIGRNDIMDEIGWIFDLTDP